MTQLAIIEAYSRLTALREHAPADVGAEYVTEFHEILEMLEQAAGLSLESFRIPGNMMQPVKVGGSYITGKWEYSEEAYCDRGYFLMRVDGALKMFELLGGKGPSAPEPPRIGFQTQRA